MVGIFLPVAIRQMVRLDLFTRHHLISQSSFVGLVTYIDQNTANSSGLLEVNSQGNAIMRVETTPVVSGNRKSIRITTQSQFNGGLVIMDSAHMPTGCGTWPAFWTNGPNWPIDGEIDIVEGVHDYTNNQATVHTNVGCTLASSSSNTLAISGSVIGGTDCAALTTGNQGCGIRSSSNNSFGAGFNSNGGGTYAMKWDTSGVAVYFFPSGSVPADITAGLPQPDSWGTAQARWPATSCDPFTFFVDHSAIFDTTLCGQWAGAVWSSAGIPGQAQSCAQRTGVSTCEAFVQANGASLSEAYWEVRSVKIYQLQN
ncbi:glycoside hydrolase family 16 protein [Flammula alnicola]|nr:glycoside hydrolase family 16 protein [Flammula alnicola]